MFALSFKSETTQKIVKWPLKHLSYFMKKFSIGLCSNILKVFLLSMLFIGTVYSAPVCPGPSIDNNHISPAVQAETVINNSFCALIELKKQNKYQDTYVLNLIREQVFPFINIEYTTKLALDEIWDALKPNQKKIFEQDLTKSIESYTPLLTDYDKFEDIYFEVSKNITFDGNKARVKIYTSTGSNRETTSITLKMVKNNDRWQIYDLVYQGISILFIERMSYGSKIQRHGLTKLLRRIQ